MGVPTFYRWLSSRYPRVLQDVKDDLNEKDIDMSNEETFALSLLSPNPNGEFDNLYIDMNGLIHPCCHPEAMPQPQSEEVMFQCIFDYIDRLFYLIRPRKLLYLAIDGVAPRAKMNQQRSRRFKSAAESDLEAETYEKVVAEFASKNIKVPPKEPRWDSNVITPGTPFMHELSKRIVKFIEDRRRVYEAWARIHVIYSDANTPGEGEHKIMNFIRNQRHSPKYNPNTRHVLHGMDADLIMLGLATHEVNFYIIREVVVMKNLSQKPENEIRKEILEAQSNPLKMDSALKSDKSYRSMLRQNWKPLQFIRLPVLREYLSHQFHFPSGWRSGKGPINFERCIDDVVLMCFFCGNDFLPHLPSISIPGGSIDQMILLYQNILPDLGDYLSNEGDLNYPQCQQFVSYIAKVEDNVFQMEQDFKQRRKARLQTLEGSQAKAQQNSNGGSDKGKGASYVDGETSGDAPDSSPQEATSTELLTFDISVEFKKRIAELLKTHREIDDPEEPIDLTLKDPKMWRAAYYRMKFGLTEKDDVDELARNVATHYIKGMSWVLKYYYQGCVSWGWYYPFHYAPFCSDLDFTGLDFTFDYGKPFTPFQQLMSVMPIRSSHCLPLELSTLMKDPESPIAHYYPTKFIEDPNGKKFRYQWIALLPFIDESQLLGLVEPIEAMLSEDDKERNSLRKERLFVGRGGTFGFVGELTKVDEYFEFVSASDNKHECRLLDGAVVPAPVLRIEDIMEEGRSRGFNGEIAKKMISNLISKEGIGFSEHDKRKGGEVLGNFNRDFHQTHNQYDPQSYPGSSYKRRRYDENGSLAHDNNRRDSNHYESRGGYGDSGYSRHAHDGGRSRTDAAEPADKRRQYHYDGNSRGEHVRSPHHGGDRQHQFQSRTEYLDRPNFKDSQMNDNRRYNYPQRIKSDSQPGTPRGNGSYNSRDNSGRYNRERLQYSSPSPPRQPHKPYDNHHRQRDGQFYGADKYKEHKDLTPHRQPRGEYRSRDHVSSPAHSGNKQPQKPDDLAEIEAKKAMYLGGLKLDPPRRPSFTFGTKSLTPAKDAQPDNSNTSV